MSEKGKLTRFWLHELTRPDFADWLENEVWNKVDLLDDTSRSDLLRQAKFNEKVAAVSAVTGEGVDNLLALIEGHLTRSWQVVSFSLPPTDGKALAWLYSHGKVLSRKDNKKSVRVSVEIEPANIERFTDRFGYKENIM